MTESPKATGVATPDQGPQGHDAAEATEAMKAVDETLQELEALGNDSDLVGVETLTRRLAQHAAALDGVSRQITRERALKALAGKVQAPAKLYDLALKSENLADESDDAQQGTRLHLDDPEPWPEEVDGAVLLDVLRKFFLRFLALMTGAAEALALWTVFTYVHDSVTVSPLLALTSPEKRCGKTTALHLLSATVRRPLPTSNITPAALFRSVEKFAPTLLVDEADTFLSEREELRGILNSGHTRGTAFVIRTVGDDHEPRLFSTWAPKIVALIGQLPSTLEDRSIPIPMRRKAPTEKVERLRLDSLDKAKDLRRKCLRWAADHSDAVRHSDPAVPPGLHDRSADNWRPLLAIADIVGGEWPEAARRAAEALSGVGEYEDSSPPVELLGDIREIFDSCEEDKLLTKSLLRKLNKDEGKPWGEWNRGKPLSAITMARLLKPFGIKPRKIRVNSKSTGQGYRLTDFEDAFHRYLPSDPEHPEQSSNDGSLRASPTRNTEDSVPARKSGRNPTMTGLVPGVPGQKGDAEEQTSAGWKAPPIFDSGAFGAERGDGARVPAESHESGRADEEVRI